MRALLVLLLLGSVAHADPSTWYFRAGGAFVKPVASSNEIAGAIAICALPPLNGFVSEWLIYIGLFRSLSLSGPTSMIAAGIAAAALAMIGTLAVAAMVKLFSTVFLGSSRSDKTEHAHEAPFTMLLPMMIAAVFCLAIGLFSAFAAPVLESAVRSWTSFPDAGITINGLAPLKWIGLMGISVLMAVLILLIFLKIKSVKNPVRKNVTWDCGYARPTARMQYTGSSFADSLVLRFGWVFFPKTRVVVPTGPFPKRAAFDSHVPDTVLDVVIVPTCARGAGATERIRAWFIGRVQFQALLVVLGLITLLGWWATW